jgi:tRNA A-37 threonylcarbamoyl transferase component Bud32
VLWFKTVADATPSGFGRYELIRRLDGGGMGEVYLARARGPERVQKTVVLKRLRPERAVDEAARARFADEARVAVSLAHPHVVPVFEFGELDGEYFLVMEWLRGGDLSRAAGIDRPPLGWAATALLGAQLCDALGYVHARKDRRGAQLVHGDLTPRNVLLSTDGHALLADFGLSRFAAQGRAGTTRYLAPEQARGEPLDGRADLYALALVLSEAATGRPAYDRDSSRAAKQARVGLVPELDDCDPDLARVLRRALAAHAADRYADATAMRDAFEALLDREPRARAAARAELVARTASASGAGAGESRSEGSAIGTREATRVPRTWARALWVGAALLVGGAGVAAGTWALRKRSLPPPVASLPATDPPPTTNAPANPAAKVAANATPGNVTPATVTPATATLPTATPATATPATAATATTVAARHPSAAATKAAPARATRPPEEPATLDVNASPWAHVRIDGQPRGETPLLGIVLPAGAHTLELVNEPLGVRRQLTVELRPGDHARRIEDLTR